jgi:predicted O-linked N-acetylglucosamine transferase (SPINDLY family)
VARVPAVADVEIRGLYAEAERLHRQGKLAEAKRLYESVLRRQPDQPDALHMLGLVAHQAKDHDAAVALLRRAIGARPGFLAAQINLATALRAAGRLDEALASIDAALALAERAGSHVIRANILVDLDRGEEALASFAAAIALEPGDADAWFNRANGLVRLRRFDAALADFDRVLALRPGHGASHYNRANALLALGRADEALSGFDQALVALSDAAAIHNNRGNALQALYRFGEAVESYERAIELDPAYSEAFNNHGNALWRLGKFEDALACYDRAIALRPGHASAHYNRGNILAELKRYGEALESYAAAYRLNPDYDFLLGTILNIQMKLSDWRDLEPRMEECRDRLMRGIAASPPFPTIFLYDDPALQRQAATIYASRFYPQRTSDPLFATGGGARIRIGYYSGDLHNNAMTYLIAEMFEAHDRDRFELFAFSFGPDRRDAMQTRVMAAFEHWHDVGALSDREIGRLSRELGIDIAVDLKGYTADGRPGIMAERCAPIQVNYLGYPGTSGAAYIDYIIGDEIVIPGGGEDAFSERIVRLPVSYFVNDSQRRISERSLTRSEVGLPAQGFVFCCFNNNYKILPAMFDIWMEILRETEGSVLWLYEESAIASDNLRREAEARGVAAERLIFASSLPLDEHLARHRLADLFLDGWPCNAHTTASDALWAGLPVLTKLGRAFAGRVAASLLDALDLTDELVARDERDYIARAIQLAGDPVGLMDIREKLALTRNTTDLFDGAAFARKMEAAYQAMLDRRRAGLPPGPIELR